MHSVLHKLFQNGQLGDAKLLMLYFYAFHELSNGNLWTGMIHGHSIHSQVNFGSDKAQLEENYAIPWTMFVEEVIPRPVNASPASAIPCNELGMPIFPYIDPGSTTPVTLCEVLREYFTECWTIPWVDLLTNPIVFYDTQQFSFPVAIQEPRGMSQTPPTPEEETLPATLNQTQVAAPAVTVTQETPYTSYPLTLLLEYEATVPY
ncbi:hypothetical protein C8R44DRAFT_744784 [Mycena epipterygia]|nr:hypothetical protein C8R44DRAFT_744784 [Mycena epipterygia]